MTRGARGALALVASAFVLASGQTNAAHRVQYRYTLLGYVKDAAGRPLRERTVTVVRDKTGFSYLAQTEADGLYLVVLRLGDESAGEALTIRVGDLSATIAARFDPDNHDEERGTRVDLEGTRFLERYAAFRPTLARYLGASPLGERATR